MTEEAQVLILGAGMTGLCAAHYLAESLGRDAVLVLESTDTVGGTARTVAADGFNCEWGPNGFLDREPATLKWMEDLGITDRLVRANERAARRFIYKQGRLIEIKPPPAFLVSSLMSLRGRARLLCEPLIPGKKDDAPETVWDFARRRIGREAADRLVSPMVSGIFGGDAKQLSLEHCFPRMAEMERTYGGLYKALRAKRKGHAAAMGPPGTLTSLREGIGGVARVAADRLGDRVRLGTRIDRLEFRACAGFTAWTADERRFNAKQVIVATPAFAAARLCAGLDPQLAAALDGIAYAGLAVVCMGFRRENVAHDLNGFGFLVPRIEDARVLGCLWDSSLFPNRAPDGYVLLRAMYGGYTDPEAVRLDDETLLGLMRREVLGLLGAHGDPELVRVFRHERGIPQYLLGHGARLKAIEAGEGHFPGLIFAGNAYRGIGLNDCVLSALRAVDLIHGMH